MSINTVAETATFQRYAADIWTDAERVVFVDWIAKNPLAGDIIQGSGGCRKVRWSRPGSGKSSGVRVIYVNRLANNAIVLLLIYAKSANDTMPPHILKKLAEEFGHAP